MDLSMIALGVSVLALALGAVAVLRAYVPPQNRAVYDLGARMQDVEFAVDQLSQRQTKRSKAEGMETARTAFKERRAAADAVLAEAQDIIEQKRQPQQQQVLPLDKNALRAQLGIVR